MHNYVLIIFCESFRTSCCISPTNLKIPTIFPEIVGFLKVVGGIQQQMFTSDLSTMKLSIFGKNDLM